MEKEFGVFYFIYGCFFVGVFYFCKKYWSCWVVLIVFKVFSVFCVEVEILFFLEGGDYVYVFVFVVLKLGCVFFVFNCVILSKRI